MRRTWARTKQAESGGGGGEGGLPPCPPEIYCILGTCNGCRCRPEHERQKGEGVSRPGANLRGRRRERREKGKKKKKDGQ